MSSSLDSPGLCLSSTHTHLTISDETGEATSNKSLSLDSLSLTKISAANSDMSPSAINPPLLIQLPNFGESPIKYYSDAPKLISLSGHLMESSTSGITPSASTLEGTLDDIPDFQEIAPLTAVVISKKADESAEKQISNSPEGSPQQGMMTPQISSPLSPQKTSPISRGYRFTPESKFIQEVKQLNKGRATSSVKSVASTTAPKTSTSGVTVVEVKPTSVNPNNSQEDREPARSVHSVQFADSYSGSLKTDTVDDALVFTSTDNDRSVDASRMSVFKTFKPTISKGRLPFLLKMPTDDEFNNTNDSDSCSENKSSRKHDRPRMVLGERSAMNNTRVSKTKRWQDMEAVSRSRNSKPREDTSRSSSGVVYVDKHNKKHRKQDVTNVMGPDGIKQIVKEEMNAVVTMQNDIWHKILDSFMERGKSPNNRYGTSRPRQPLIRPTKPNELVMLELPKEDIPIYNPLKIPILKPKTTPSMLFLPPDEPSPEKLVETPTIPAVALKDGVTNSAELLEPVPKNVADVAIQTNTVQLESPKVKPVHVHQLSELEESDHPPLENIPKRHNLIKPPSQNVEYQKIVNENEIPYKAIKECKMLLESIQNSANELKDVKLGLIQHIAAQKQSTEGEPHTVISKPHDLVIKTKHEIFLEKFFSETGDHKHQHPKAYNKFLDVLDISCNTSSKGHFEHKYTKTPKAQSHKTKKAKPDFLHSMDITEPGKTYQITKPQLLDTGKVFASKQEIPRTPTGSPDIVKIPEILEIVTENQLEQSLGPPSEMSDSLSSIGKYLPSEKVDEMFSDSDKTITEHDHHKQPSSISSVRSDHIFDDIDNADQSTPKKNLPSQKIIFGEDNLSSKVSSNESCHPTPKDPTAFSHYLAQNISQIKQAYSEAHQREIDRSKRVNMLLLSKSNVQNKHAQESPKGVTEPQKKLGATHVISTNKPLKPQRISEASRLITNTATPLRDADVRKSDDISILSNTTSLPTNTDDLINAALNSESTLVGQSKPGVAAKQTASVVIEKEKPEQRGIDEWMKEKRKQRMVEFRKERDEKIKREPHPFKQDNTQPVSSNKRQPEYDRKAAILRRLNAAEELFNDIKHTPTPKVSGQKGPQNPDRTTEWVHGLNLADFDSVHSPTLTSEGGASALTADISLP